MVELTKLRRPKKPAESEVADPDAPPQAATTPAKAKRQAQPKTQASAEPVAPDTSNLHKPVRGEPVFKQFRLDPDIVREFTIAAREHGYRRDNQFFVAVWEFWKKHNS